MIRNNNLSMGLVKMHIIQARQAIEYFDKSNFKNIKNSAAYEIQQSCETLIKIQIYSLCSNLNYYKLYTHNLSQLYTYSKDLGINIYVPKCILANFDKITSWEAGSRYSIGFSIRIDTLKRYLYEVQDWYNILYKKGYR